jgi:hypothetical protein
LLSPTGNKEAYLRKEVEIDEDIRRNKTKAKDHRGIYEVVSRSRKRNKTQQRQRPRKKSLSHDQKRKPQETDKPDRQETK